VRALAPRQRRAADDRSASGRGQGDRGPLERPPRRWAMRWEEDGPRPLRSSSSLEPAREAKTNARPAVA